jgi:hypothetical protein
VFSNIIHISSDDVTFFIKEKHHKIDKGGMNISVFLLFSIIQTPPYSFCMKKKHTKYRLSTSEYDP